MRKKKKSPSKAALLKDFRTQNDKFQKITKQTTRFIPMKSFYRYSAYPEASYRFYWANSEELIRAAYPSKSKKVTKDALLKAYVKHNKAYLKTAPKSASYLSARLFCKASGFTIHSIYEYWPRIEDFIAEALPKEVLNKKLNVGKDEFLQLFKTAFTQFKEENKKAPFLFLTFRRFIGRSKTDQLKRYFKGFSDLYSQATQAFSEKEKIKYGIPVDTIEKEDQPLSREDIHVEKDSSKKRGGIIRCFISTVLPDSILNVPLFSAVQGWSKAVDGEIVILPGRGIHHTHVHYSKEVQAIAHHFVTYYQLGSNLKIIEAKIPPMSADPIQSSKRLAKNHSLIIGHPKQNMSSLPVLDPNNKPKVIISTGVLTEREYPKTASGFKGELDSVLGGVILEYEVKTEKFFWRFVQANSDGSFYDLGKQYMPDGSVKDVKAEYLYVADVHSGFTLPYARKATLEMANQLGVKALGAGDWSDFYSISHHHEKNIKTKVTKYHNRPDLNTLNSELNTLANELRTWKRGLNPGIDIDVIKSNHDEHLNRYIEEQRFVNDPSNYRIALELAVQYLDGQDPIKYWIQKYHPDLIEGINWISRKDIKKVSEKNILVSEHGDLGPNGSRSTNINAEWSLQDCVLGHAHSPAVLRSVFRVGTLALDLEYVRGASSWQVMNCVIYPNGARQMIWIDSAGRWHL